jgi:pyruvate ferredoxin oxidoreductase delta subunit
MEPLVKRIEINYRGIFQKQLAKKIANYIVYVAHSEGKIGFSNGRYSDSPERNGVPCKFFAFVSPDLSDGQLEAVCGSKMDIDAADVSVVLDEAMVKGVEPWGWHGVRPINEKVKAGGKMLVVSKKEPDEMLRFVEKKPYEYDLAILDGEASFSGLWVYKDDLTDIRVLAAIARIDPQIIGIKAVEDFVRKTYKDEKRVASAREAYDTVAVHPVGQSQGMKWPYVIPQLPKWNEMEEGIVVPAVQRGYSKGPGGQTRNETFKRGTTKSMRPLVRFDICTKCTLCWLECPDEVFDPTVDGFYDVNYEYCTGCGKCAQVCPVNECIVMVDELKFENNDSPWTEFKKDPRGYVQWVEMKKGKDRVIHNVVTGTGLNVMKVDKPTPQKEEGARGPK